MADPQYAVDRGPQQITLSIEIPAGVYAAKWIDPQNGDVKAHRTLQSADHALWVRSPPYSEDMVLQINRLKNVRLAE